MATVVEVITPTNVSVVEVHKPGPQGPKGDPGDISPSSQETVSGVYTVLPGFLRSTRILRLSGNLTIGTLPTIPSDVAGVITFVLKQPTSGGPFTVTWPGGVKWAAGAPAPIMPTSPDSTLAVHLFWNGVEWLGSVMGVYT